MGPDALEKVAQGLLTGLAQRWKRTLRIAGALWLILYAYSYIKSSSQIVSTGETAIVERFGKFSRIAKPGLHWVFWPFDRIAGRLSTRVQQLNVETDTKTKDNVTLDLTVAVQFRVIDRQVESDGKGTEESASTEPAVDQCEQHGMWRAYYRLSGIEKQLRAYVEDVVRSELPLKTLDEAYETKDAVAVAVRRSLQKDMRWYGYEILNALVTDLQPNHKVRQRLE